MLISLFILFFSSTSNFHWTWLFSVGHSCVSPCQTLKRLINVRAHKKLDPWFRSIYNEFECRLLKCKQKGETRVIVEIVCISFTSRLENISQHKSFFFYNSLWKRILLHLVVIRRRHYTDICGLPATVECKQK